MLCLFRATGGAHIPTGVFWKDYFASLKKSPTLADTISALIDGLCNYTLAPGVKHELLLGYVGSLAGDSEDAPWACWIRVLHETAPFDIEADDLTRLTFVEQSLKEYASISGVQENILHTMTAPMFVDICDRTKMGSHTFTARFGSIILDEVTKGSFCIKSLL